MSTTGIDSWAVDLADVGPIYPFQGTEMILVGVGVVAWLVWHLIQMKAEQNQLREETHKYGSAENIKRSLDND
ncbi:MAG: hypothetical protein V3U65_16680 [Granulosicoccaceae bacterium]